MLETKAGFAACVALLMACGVVLGAEDFPRDWFWHQNDQQWQTHQQIVGKRAPGMQLTGWMNGAVTPKHTKGKIVVVDFWATWCGPCIASIPHNNAMLEKYKDKGFAIVGVCNKRGAETMGQVVKEKGITYPTAIDASGGTEKAWRVQWYPTYAVVDRKGVLRAIGLKPDSVDKVVDKLLEEQPAEESDSKEAAAPAVERPEAAAAQINPQWLEGSAELRARLAGLEGKEPPTLQVANWINGEVKASDLKGKVVVVDFWATWCPPCIASIPHNNQMAQKYKDQGLVLIAVCATRGAEIMAKTVQDRSIRYPVVADIDGKTFAAFKGNGYPDYYIIDRTGKLRIADCNNAAVEEAVKALLAEPAPTAASE